MIANKTKVLSNVLGHSLKKHVKQPRKIRDIQKHASNGLTLSDFAGATIKNEAKSCKNLRAKRNQLFESVRQGKTINLYKL